MRLDWRRKSFWLYIIVAFVNGAIGSAMKSLLYIVLSGIVIGIVWQKFWPIFTQGEP